MNEMKGILNLDPGKFLKIATGIGMFLLAGHFIFLANKYYLNFSMQETLEVFYFESNSSLFFYSTAAFKLFGTLLLFRIGVENEHAPAKLCWLVLGCSLFILFYNDVLNNIVFDELLWVYYNISSFFGFMWVVPHFLLIAAVSMLFFYAFDVIPLKTACLLLASLLGHFVLSFYLNIKITELWAVAGGLESKKYQLLSTFNNLLGWSCIALFIYALLDFANVKNKTPKRNLKSRKNTLPKKKLFNLNKTSKVMAKDHGPQIKDDEQYEALRKAGNSKEKAARIANSGSRKTTGSKGGHATKYEERPKKELYDKAKQVGIEGRSKMSKKELIDALRNH